MLVLGTLEVRQLLVTTIISSGVVAGLAEPNMFVLRKVVLAERSTHLSPLIHI